MKIELDYPEKSVLCNHAYRYNGRHCIHCGAHQYLTELYMEMMNEKHKADGA
jgi:hypothetical protein